MDLLTSDGESSFFLNQPKYTKTKWFVKGWLPSYRYVVFQMGLTYDKWTSISISAVLLQIKLAISNLDPRPARLANNWNQ